MNRLAGGLMAVGLATMMAGTAGAVDMPGTTLGPAISFEYFGLIVQDNVRRNTDVGTLDISGTLSCASKCTATTRLGASPFVDLYVSEMYDPYAGGGYALAELKYYVQYNNPVADTYDVTVKASDILAISPGSLGETYLGFGRPFDSSSYVFGGPLLIDAPHCAAHCDGLFAVDTGAPIGSYNVQMIANVPYLVHLLAKIYPNNDGSVSHAAVDPTFTTSATGGSFSFSPGVTAAAAVPEPATWAMLVLGFGLTGAAMRRRGVRAPAMPVAAGPRIA